MSEAKSIYDISVLDYQHVRHSLAEFRGKVLLIVNVASFCGLAKKSYEELCSLCVKYHRRGLRILLFPCRQFMSQEYSDIMKVKEFTDQYNDKFILMDMVDVKGKNMHPLYKYLVENLQGWLTNSIKWNFTYFLIGRDGELARRYGPTERLKEDDPDLLRCIGTVEDEKEEPCDRVAMSYDALSSED